MRDAGAGEPTVRLSLSVLQSILQLAVTEGLELLPSPVVHADLAASPAFALPDEQ